MLSDSFTREFEREIKNDVTSTDNIINIKGYSNVIKLFRVIALVTRFVKNLFRKTSSLGKGQSTTFYKVNKSAYIA